MVVDGGRKTTVTETDVLVEVAPNGADISTRLVTMGGSTAVPN